MKLKLEPTQRNWIWAGGLMVIGLVLMFIGKASPIAWIIFSVLLIALLFIKTEFKESYTKYKTAVSLLGGAILSYHLMQYIILDAENYAKTSKGMAALNILIIFALNLIALIACNRTALAGTIVHSIVMFLAFADYFVYQFRQNEIVFSDIRALRTGMNVAVSYQPRLHDRGVIAIYITILFFVLLWKINTVFYDRKLMSILSGVLATLCVIIVLFSVKGKPTETWELKGSYKNGFLYNFVLSIRDGFVSEPKDYSLDTIHRMETLYESASSKKLVAPKKDPTIIVIMNESFADLKVIGNINTNQTVTPFLDSLTENTVKGYALSSVFGAKTPNSEWEFLTGNTMAFLPEGAVAYQQFLPKNPVSVLDMLKASGYTCVAMHPYYETGWSRNRIYPRLGFDEMHFMDDFDQNNVLREYITDEELYNRIIERFESKTSGEKLFMMNITMQNHGGYTKSYENFQEEIYKIGPSYSDANQYLSLVHESDKALEKLVRYFESVEEPVEIVFFGDHQPGLNSQFYRILNNKGLSGLTLEELQNLYTVPFFVWTNYESPAKEIEYSSLNLLSCYMLEYAGLELDPYRQFLLRFRDVIPAINARGYYSAKDKEFKAFGQAYAEEKDWLELYEILQYNSMFDKKHRSEVFFSGVKE